MHSLLVQLLLVQRAEEAEAAEQKREQHRADGRADDDDDEHQVVLKRRPRRLDHQHQTPKLTEAAQLSTPQVREEARQLQSYKSTRKDVAVVRPDPS